MMTTGYPSRWAGYDEHGGYRSRGWARPSDYEDHERGWFDRASDEVSSWMGDEDAARQRRLDKVEGEHRGKGRPAVRTTSVRTGSAQG
jgi:osmotically-inducible protein OsmY